ncbi:MAG: Methionyl-tRNA formyltransferase, partial [Bacteroidota bacterium]
TLDQIIRNEVVEIPQIESVTLKTASKLYTETTIINWKKTTVEVKNFVRGLTPYPVARTEFDNKNLLVYSISNRIDAIIALPGTFFSDNKSYLAVQCSDGILNLEEIKLEGKRKMNVIDLLNGYDISHLNLISI